MGEGRREGWRWRKRERKRERGWREEGKREVSVK